MAPTAPVLIAPIGGEQISERAPAMYFTAPTDADNKTFIFMLEIDTANPPTSGNPDYSSYESRFSTDFENNGNWEVWSDSINDYVKLPESGLTYELYGRLVKMTVPASKALVAGKNYYWRVSVSDDMQPRAIFNQATFGIATFTSS